MLLAKLNLKSDFVKSLIVLVTGTVIAQFIALLASPIITRLYSQEEMGDLGIYMRFVAFISAVGTLRYELAIPLPKADSDGYHIFRLALQLLLKMILVFAIFGLMFLLLFERVNDILFWIITIISSFFVSFINIGTNWSIRKQEFRAISNQRIFQATGVNGFRVLFGLFSFGSLGLILATLIGYVLSSIQFFGNFIKSSRLFGERSRVREKELAKEYKEFPTINLIHISVDLGKDLAIAALIALHFGKDIFGLYVHAYSMLTLPLKVIGNSISQVFYSKCSELVNDGKSTIPILTRTIKTLLLLSIVPFTVIFLFGEPIFGFVFGRSWSDSGLFASIMSLWLLMNFVFSPLSTLPLVLRRQREFFIASLLGGALQLIGFGILPYIGPTKNWNFTSILWFVTLTQLLYYSVLALLFIRFAKKGVRE